MVSNRYATNPCIKPVIIVDLGIQEIISLADCAIKTPKAWLSGFSFVWEKRCGQERLDYIIVE